MKKIIFAFLFVVLCVSSASCTEYPALGMSTGDYVRLRENPDTKSEILGRIFNHQHVIVFGERMVKGEKWYEIDHPTEDKTAWVFGKYISLYDNTGKLQEVSVNIRADFGLTPEKTRILLGKPNRSEKSKFFFEPANQELSDETLEYSGCELRYIENELNKVEVSGENFTFDSLSVGGTKKDITALLGEPDIVGNDMWLYEISEFEGLFFHFSGDTITKMVWERNLD